MERGRRLTGAHVMSDQVLVPLREQYYDLHSIDGHLHTGEGITLTYW